MWCHPVYFEVNRRSYLTLEIYLISVAIKIINCNVSYLLKISAQSAIQDVLQKAEKISESMDEVQMKADMVSSNVKNKLRPHLEQLSSDFQVNAVINHSKFVTASFVENFPFNLEEKQEPLL
jgi:hypothetical protein